MIKKKVWFIFALWILLKNEYLKEVNAMNVENVFLLALVVESDKKTFVLLEDWRNIHKEELQVLQVVFKDNYIKIHGSKHQSIT